MGHPVAFMFSGQGSHYFQMGGDLFEQHPVFRREMLAMDALAAPVLGTSVVETLYHSGRRKDELFDQTAATSAAIFMVQYALARALMEDGVKPDLVLSTSLGIFAAAAVAGALSVEDALGTVTKLGLIFERECEKGAMLALLAERDLFDQWEELRSDTELAAENLASHFVVSTPLTRLERVLSMLNARDITFSRLAVSHAFHSKWIDPAEASAMTLLAPLRYRKPSAAMLCCTEGRIIAPLEADHFWRALRRPIRFAASVEALEKRAAHLYVDIGPTGTLASFLKRGLPAEAGARVKAVMTPFGGGLRNYELLRAEFAAPAADLAPQAAPSRPAPVSWPSRLRSDEEVFVFPGQGSQFKGMGADLFERSQAFLEQEKNIDALLGYSLRELCLSDPGDRLRNTAYTQPSLYVINALHYYKALEQGRHPAALAGHSLGEYNALLGAGVFDFMTGLRIVQKRGELMALAKDGGMAAIVGLDRSILDRILLEENLGSLDLASHNTPSQLVLSGPKDDIARALPVLEKAGAQLCMALPVSAAFHSRYMSQAAERFAEYLKSFEFQPFSAPVVSNVTASFYPQANPTPLLIKQIVSPVRWMESVRFLAGQGAETFSELGPGSVLTNMVRDIRATAQPAMA